jgi:tRNA threonylcarbamoyl adenosine modification protein YeaZ
MCVVLAIDTASRAASAAVARGGTILSRFSASETRGAEMLSELLVKSLESAAVSIDDIDLLLVSVGPGSFTGIRTGIAAAEGLRFGRELPLLGISVLLTGLVPHLRGPSKSLVVMRANEKESYCCLLEAATAGEESRTFALRALSEVLVCSTREIDERGVAALGIPSAEGQSTTESDWQRVDINPTGGENAAAELARCYFLFDETHSQLPSLMFQRSAGNGPRVQPLYVKSVQAKTLVERGLKRS